MSIKLEYSSNNSGGNWWLKDEDWQKLEAAGWQIEWCKDKSAGILFTENGRFLGALATSASKTFETPDEGVAEWKSVTGQDPWVEGCNCCGRPHSFCYVDAKGRLHFAGTEIQSSFAGWS